MLGRVFPPATLQMLSDVLSKHCHEHPEISVDEKEQLAVRLIEIFESGVCDPVVLARRLAEGEHHRPI